MVQYIENRAVSYKIFEHYFDRAIVVIYFSEKMGLNLLFVKFVWRPMKILETNVDHLAGFDVFLSLSIFYGDQRRPYWRPMETICPIKILETKETI